ncbi:tryptophan 2,3-dioxygenase family protein [Nonomuraea sp. NPDC046570]|uniref:tryptophan 2,3-dioxygenase n=1 Tax=Nonomuraea sp. NPDC046570 TaxID=3155255 RepID=UPI0033C6B128
MVTHAMEQAEVAGGQLATPYDEYVGTAVLHGLLRPLTDAPEEPAFLVTTQVMELYFGLLCTEWRLAQRQLDAGDAAAATTTLRRSAWHFEALNAAWASLSRLTPGQFNRFREALGEASGFQSAMYRHVEFLLGTKSTVLLRPYRRTPEVYAELEAALHAPSLYDSVVSLLARRGFDVPDGVRAEGAEPDPRVEAAWLEVYQGDDDGLRELAESLVDLATQFSDWRYRHVLAVRRSMGAKPGSGGSSGLRFLEQSMRREIFPEMWAARTAM